MEQATRMQNYIEPLSTQIICSLKNCAAYSNEKEIIQYFEDEIGLQWDEDGGWKNEFWLNWPSEE